MWNMNVLQGCIPSINFFFYPLRDFHKMCRVCTAIQEASAVKILLDLLKGLWSDGGFKLTGSGYPKIFSDP